MEAKGKVEWIKMTWKEIACLSKDTVLLLPVGSCEQNGPQNPVGYDSIVAEYFVREVAKRTGSVFLPTIPFGYSCSFRSFPGTIWLRPESLRAIMEDIVGALADQGFWKLLAVINHEPNEPMFEHAVRSVSQGRRMVVASVWPVGILKEAAASVFGKGVRLGHGGEPTTSVLKALTPTDVRMDLLREIRRPRSVGPFSVETSSTSRMNDVKLRLYLDAACISDTGVMGDTVIGDAERGRLLLDTLVEKGVGIVRGLASVTREGSCGPEAPPIQSHAVHQ